VRGALRVVLFLGVAAAASPIGAAYGEDEKLACISASEKAQQLRDEGKLMQQRLQLLICTRDICPNAVRKDCSAWLGTLDASLPTVVFSAQDAEHHDLIQVRVSVDGTRMIEALDGKAVPIDPGPHTFRFESEGRKPVEQSVLIREGEQRRTVTVQFSAEPGPATVIGAGLPPPPEPPPEPHPDTKKPGSAPIPTAAYVLGGVGIAALGGFIGFGITGNSELSDLRSNCKPSCAPSDVDAARTKYIVADAMLGTSIVALGIATILVLTRGPAVPKTKALDLHIAPFSPSGSLGSSVGLRF
jgi:hypothetical protein